MASESTEEETVAVTLPAELGDWLDSQAAALDTERGELVVQLLAAYRAVEDRGDVADLTDALDQDAVVDRVVARVDERIEETAAGAAEDLVAEHIDVAPATVRSELTERIDALSAEVDEKIDDVRKRVIQVKREADAKAPADHDHEEFARLESAVDGLATVETRIGTLLERVEEAEEGAEAAAAHEERLEELDERLQTVAWVVSDLREAYESGATHDAVDRLRRAAAEADVARANCENCGEGVEIGLLTEPNCPHCDATVADVEPATGWFGSPQLLVASQLEAGDDE